MNSRVLTKVAQQKLLPAVSGLLMTSMLIAGGTPIDWADPGAVSTFPGGWTAAACNAEVPIVCVERAGEYVGAVDVVAYPADTYPGAPDPETDPEAFLRWKAEDFQTWVAEDRAEGCGPGYRVDLIGVREQTVFGADGIRLGFRGRYQGQPVSEMTILYMTVIDGHVVVMNGSGYNDGSCVSGEGVFNVGDLRRFGSALDRLAADTPVPTFLFNA